MQSHARVVIIGGGMMGVGLLYHLAEAGWTDVVLIEKAALTSGSTWHAAGQCPSFIANYNLAKIHHYSNTLYPRLEAMTGQPTGWHGCGGIRLATRPEEVDYFRLVAGVAKNVGFRMEIIGLDEIRRLNPFLQLHGVYAGAWTLDDGHVDPSSCCNAMALAARNLGASVILNNRVTGAAQLPNGEFEVTTEQGAITCEHLVNAAGCYADRVGAWLGVPVPFTNMKHQYLVTDEIPEFAARAVELPVTRDPSASSYYRQEQNSGLIGLYERSDTREAWPGTGPAWESESELFPAEYEPIMPWLDRVMARMPVLANAGLRRVVNGAISHTIDSNPLVGPAPGVRNFWMCTGSSIGIAQGAGCGKYLAQWMMTGASEINLLSLDPRRFARYADKEYTAAKAHQEYWNMYHLQLPGEEVPAGRPKRVTPLYPVLKAKGAVYGETLAWERPKWFSLDGREEQPSFQRNNTFAVVAEECRAVRERAGVMELPSFSKFDVSGPDAAAFLDRITANRLPRRAGGVVLTHALTEGGRYQTEFTITRWGPERFFLLSAAWAHLRDVDLLNFSRRPGERVTIADVTENYTTLIIAGPRAREVLAPLTEADLSNAAFPWLTGREITVAGAPVRALRVNYVGELGWELHLPVEHAVQVYAALWAAGAAVGLADFGLYAMNSLRLEKAYAGWGAELTNEITPIEAGLERFVHLDKDFVGKAAVQRGQAEGVQGKLAYVEVAADDADVYGGEAVWAGGAVVGVTTSGGYGHHTQKSLAFVYVKPEYSLPGMALEIELLGQRRAATVLAGPVYDPANARPRM
ncbi:MAG: FAD-dependent oxidoreductase [Anaerolineales bacterium]|nr:FAD-dependent oxidoreductase [Anaerolineales bacterium]